MALALTDQILGIYTFAGRRGRLSYINVHLVIFALAIVAYFLFQHNPKIFYFCAVFLSIGSLCVTAQRLHDVDMSAFWLIVTVALVPWLILLTYLCFKPGTKGANRFGGDPSSPVQPLYQDDF